MLRVYDTITGLLAWEMPGHRGRISAVTFSKDGCWIASAAMVGVDGSGVSEIKILSAARGEEVDVALPQIAGRISALGMSADGSLLAAGHPTAGPVRVFDVRSGRQARALAGPASCWDVEFDPHDGQTLLAADRTASRVYLWNIGTGALVHDLPGPAAATSVCYSPDGRRVAAVGQEAEVHLYDAATGEELIALASQGQATRTIGWTPCVAFSPDGRQIASKHLGRRVDVWTAPQPTSNFRDQRRREAAEGLPFWHVEQASAARLAGDREAVTFHLAYTSQIAACGMGFWLKKAWAHGMLRQADEQEAALTKAVEAAPADPSPWYARGKFRHQQRNWSAALADLSESQRLFTAPPPDLEELLATCRARLEEHEAAGKHWSFGVLTGVTVRDTLV